MEGPFFWNINLQIVDNTIVEVFGFKFSYYINVFYISIYLILATLERGNVPISSRQAGVIHC